MPKAFLLKYKKRCEYFGQRPDEIGISANTTEAIDLKKTSNDPEEKMTIKELPSLKKHQYHVQNGNTDKTDKIYPQDHNDRFKSESNEHGPSLEIMKIEADEKEETSKEAMSINETHCVKKYEKEERTFNEQPQYLYQPLTPPSPQTSTSTYASTLLQQLQIHRNHASEKQNNVATDIFSSGNNPLNQLAEISLAAAAAHANNSKLVTEQFEGHMNSSLAKQNIIANLMFPTILQHIQQHQQTVADNTLESEVSVHSVPTPSNTPSPPPAHLSPFKYQCRYTEDAPKNSTLMEILSKPPLKPAPPVAHIHLPRPDVSISKIEGPTCYLDPAANRVKSSFHENKSPYGAITRLQLLKPAHQLPPPQNMPEDLSINKIARRLNFKDVSYEDEDKEEKQMSIFNRLDRLQQSHHQQILPQQPREVFLNNVLKTTLLPQISMDRVSVESRSSEGSSLGQHECQDCGKIYSTSSNLARHRQTHRSLEDKKARKCPHCDKAYVSMPAYSMHIRTHNQGCKCQYCGKCFSRPWLLQGHVRTHTGEKPFSCKICEKTFADKSNLRAHIQTHSNTKPFVCQRCNKAFALKSYLYKHEESSCMRMLRPSSSDENSSLSSRPRRRRQPQQRSEHIVPMSDPATQSFLNPNLSPQMSTQESHDLQSYRDNISPRPVMELEHLNKRQLLLHALVASSTNGNNQQKQQFRQTPSPAPSVSSTTSSSHGSSLDNFRENAVRSYST